MMAVVSFEIFGEDLRESGHALAISVQRSVYKIDAV